MIANTAATLAEMWRRGETSAVLNALDAMGRDEAIATAVYILHHLDRVDDAARAAVFMRTLAALC